MISTVSRMRFCRDREENADIRKVLHGRGNEGASVHALLGAYIKAEKGCHYSGMMVASLLLTWPITGLRKRQIRPLKGVPIAIHGCCCPPGEVIRPVRICRFVAQGCGSGSETLLFKEG